MKSTQSVKSSEIKQVDEPKTGKVSETNKANETNKVNEVNKLSRDRSNSSNPSALVTFEEKVQIGVQKKQENKQQRDVSNKILTNGSKTVSTKFTSSSDAKSQTLEPKKENSSAAKQVISDKMKARIAMFERG